MILLKSSFVIVSIKRCKVDRLHLGLALKQLHYFREECSDKGGTNDGTCASGYGICCTCKFLTNGLFCLW